MVSNQHDNHLGDCVSSFGRIYASTDPRGIDVHASHHCQKDTASFPRIAPTHLHGLIWKTDVAGARNSHRRREIQFTPIEGEQLDLVGRGWRSQLFKLDISNGPIEELPNEAKLVRLIFGKLRVSFA